MTQRIYRANGIVLRRSNFAEKDRLVTFLTRERGKVRAIAKGARNPKSRLAGATELFNAVKLLLAVGRTFDIVSQCEVVRGYGSVAEDLDRMALACTAVELTDALVPEGEPQPRLLPALAAALDGITDSPNPASVARCFEVHAIVLLGYAPVLDCCAVCGERRPGRVALSPLAGGVVCERCFPSASDGMAVSAVALRSLRALSRLDAEQAGELALPAEVHAEIARVWTPFLEARIERGLRSAEFARAIQHSWQGRPARVVRRA